MLTNSALRTSIKYTRDLFPRKLTGDHGSTRLFQVLSAWGLPRLELGSRDIFSTPLREKQFGVLRVALFPDVRAQVPSWQVSADGTRILARRYRKQLTQTSGCSLLPVSLLWRITKKLGFSSPGKRPSHLQKAPPVAKKEGLAAF